MTNSVIGFHKTIGEVFITKDALSSDIGNLETNDDTLRKANSIFHWKKFTNGFNIQLISEYGYGLIPVDYESVDYGWYRTFTGELNIDMILPIKLLFEYRKPEYTGLKNPFTLSFDRNKFEENHKRKVISEISELDKRKNELQLEKSRFVKDGIYSEKRAAYFKSINSTKQIPSTPTLNDTLLNYKMLNENSDDLKYQTITGDFPGDSIPSGYTPNNDQKPGDSFKTGILPDTQSINDSLNYYQSKAIECKNAADSIAATINTLERTISGIKARESDMSILQKGKVYNLFKNVRKIEIGYFSPDYSDFLLSGSHIRGFNFELNSKIYLAVAHGLIIDPLLMPFNEYQKLNTNYFDQFSNLLKFSDLKYGRRVTFFKTGFGAMENNHIHFGVLTGKSKTNYLSDTITINSPVHGIQKNLVFQIDTKYILNGKNDIDIQVAKSLIENSISSSDGSQTAMNDLLKNNLTAAYSVKYTSNLTLLRTRILLAGKYIEPFFKSFGLSYLRSDVLTMEVKTDHYLSKKIKAVCRFKNMTDNLHKLYGYTTKMQSSSLQINYKINRRLNLTVIENPIYYYIKDMENITGKYSYNFSNLILVYIPKSKVTQHVITSTFSQFYYYDGLNKNIAFNSGINHNISLKNSITTNIQIDHNLKYINSSIFEQASSIRTGLTKTFKKVLLNSSITGIYSDVSGWDYGFMLGANYSFHENLSSYLSIEKFAYQGFQMAINDNEIPNNVPYFITVRLNASF